MMATVAARELADGEWCSGSGCRTSPATWRGGRTPPNLVLITNRAPSARTPSRLPVSIGDPALVTGSLMVCGMAMCSSCFCRTGGSKSVSSAAHRVDRYGNINTTVIGPYERPKVRLPGLGGAAEIAIHAHRILIVSKLSPRTFPERVMDVRDEPRAAREPCDHRQGRARAG